MQSTLSAADRRAALALAEAIIPGTLRIPGADDAIVDRAARLVGEMSSAALGAWTLAQRALDAAAIAKTGKRFSALDAARMDELLAAWMRDPVLRVPLGLVSLVYKMAHFDDPDVYRAMGGRSNQLGGLDSPRWLSQIHRADEWAGDRTVDCDVVVIGTGAGGAVVGRELADRGHAVIFVEEGEHYRRDAFTGSMATAHSKFYRAAIALGNATMPIFIGRLVGGSTAVNGGTCFRTPRWVLDEWCDRLGTDAFAPDRMEEHFARVEDVLGVEPPARPEIGPIADVIARGCDALGWSHFPIRRNVKGCAGGGFCDFGCGTDARRSTNLSYVPPALERGALLFTGLRANEILVEGGRATGIRGVTASGRSLTVRARRVVLAGGSVPTPLLLLRQGIANRSGQVGRNLTLHPSTALSGVVDDEVRPWAHIPQGYGCDQFLERGILLATAQPDFNVAPQIFPLVGRRLMRALEDLNHLACLSVLVRDSEPTGRVWFDAGLPAVTYTLTQADRARLHEALVLASEILFSAGAKRLYAPLYSTPIIERDDVRRFREEIPGPADMTLVSYHPLGTCKMGTDPRTSVIGFDHQSHDVRGLHIVDGSAVPGALGVNPQITIMAMANRAARILHDAL